MVGAKSHLGHVIQNQIKKQWRRLKKTFQELVEKNRQEAQKQKMNFRVMFQDEARFGRINDPRRCWAPKGVRPEVSKQIIREYTYAYAAVSPVDGSCFSLILPSMTGECMSIFLEEVGKHYAEDYILIFLDGAACHKGQKISVPANIKLEVIPPYSPQLNPVENLWEEIREKHFTNLVFDSMNAVEIQLIQALLDLETHPALVRSISSFSWIITPT
jgi:transposase